MDADTKPEPPFRPQPQFTASAPVSTPVTTPTAPVPPQEQPPAVESVRSFNPLTGFPIAESPDAEGASVTLTHLGPAYEVADSTSGKVFAPGIPKKVTQEDADRLQAAHPFERWRVGEESVEA